MLDQDTLSPAGRAPAGEGPPPRRRRLSAAQKDSLTGYLFIAPELIGITFFVVVPVCMVVWYSFNSWNVLAGTIDFVGLENYDRLFNDPKLAPVLTSTAIFSAGLVVLNIALALGLAVLLNRSFRGVTFFRTVFFSPVVVSLLAWVVVWSFLLQDDGGINSVLLLFGVEGPNWLREGPTAMASVIIVQVFKNVGMNMVLFLAALQGVPREILEAGRMDGAGSRALFWRVTVPLISPTILLAGIITIVGSLQVFAQISVLTSGGPGISTTVLVYYLYQQAFEFHDFGYGSTLALLLFIIVAVLTILQWQLRKRWVFYEN